MSNVETFFLQPFKTRKRLVPGQRVPAKTKHYALSDGERLGRTAEGVAVIHVTADDETGEVSALGTRSARRDSGAIRAAARSDADASAPGQPAHPGVGPG